MIILLVSCNRSQLDSRTIIQINNVKISRYEYEKELNRALLKYNNDEKNKVTKQFCRDFLNNIFFIAEAYNKGYDTIQILNEKVKAVSDFMMAQRNGYLWNRNITPIVDKFAVPTKSMISKRNKIYYFDYIEITSLDSLNTIIDIQQSDNKIMSREDFERIKSFCHQYNFISNNYSIFQWPFLFFEEYTDVLYNMKPGEIKGLLHVKDFFYYVYLDHIEEVNNDDDNFNSFVKELKILKENELNNAKCNEMDMKGELSFFSENINLFYTFIESGNSPLNYPDNFILLKYHLNDSTNYLDVDKYKNYIKNMPLVKVIKGKEDLEYQIKQYYYNEFMKDEAMSLGLYKSKTFLLDRNNYKNKLILNHYLQENILSKIKIDTSEVEEYYLNHNSDYIISKAIIVNLIYFKESIDAEKALTQLGLNGFGKEEYRLLEKVDTIIFEEAIDIEKTPIPQDILKELINIQGIGCCKQLIPSNDKVLLIVKKRNQDNYKPPLHKIYNIVYKTLYNEKIQLYKNAKIEDLKKEYNIVINKTGIDY
ncbi:MAG: hypothetical protein ACERKD_24285 [Prolixibacteraceae bacterium]